MGNIIDTVAEHLPEIAEHRTKPPDAAVAGVEDMVSHAMFEYYTRLYNDNPEWKKTQYVTNVAEKFGVTVAEIENKYRQYRWFSRAKKAIFDGAHSGMLSTPATDALDQMLCNTNLIATLGTRFVTDFLKEANPALMTPKDVHKIGMLVVECVRVANEVRGVGSGNQAQGQTINLVINE
jgi:hypothetical protein